ncbi:MAG: hypothetical protein WCJ46_06650 [bacterium]
MKKIFSLTFIFFTVASSFIFGAPALSGATTNPYYICPGQAFTVTYYMSSGGSPASPANIVALAVISTDSNINLPGDYKIFGDSSQNPPISTQPGTNAAKYIDSNDMTNNYLPYTIITQMPSGGSYVEGATVHILISIMNTWYTTENTLASSGTKYDLAVTLSCHTSRITNTGGIWYAKSNSLDIDINDCNTTPTITHTSTPTPTSTGTQTNTPTRTPTTPPFSPTVSPSYTGTPTITETLTPTSTKTITATTTVTPTFTQTATITCTYTITPTPPPYPYIITIELYNEAGEKVKVIANTFASAMFSDIFLYNESAGVESSDTDIFDNSYNNNLNIKIPGVHTPDQGDDSIFVWNGQNTGGQKIVSGKYYIKISEQDAYGHTQTMTRDLTILSDEQYVIMTVFNSAGEIVQKITTYKNTSTTSLALDLGSETLFISKTKPVTIKYGKAPTEYLIWDGKNSQGDMVHNGVYEIRVEIKNTGGGITSSSKTVTILNDVNKDKNIGEVRVIPNPFMRTYKNSCKVFWTGTGAPEDTKIAIYNSVGELVCVLYAPTGKSEVIWNGKSTAGSVLSSGIYTAVVSARKDNGQFELVMSKFVIIAK